MLSFDFSDRQINIVKGDNTANRIRIDNSATVQVPGDMIVNGEVIQLSGLSELLLTTLRSEQMMDRDAVVTFSSSSIVFKELIVPKAKGSEFLQMVQNHMSQEMGISNEYSISYTVVGEAGEQNPGSLKVLATACPSSIVEGFKKLFAVMNINLRSVNISCNSISRIVLSDKSNADKMPLLVCQLDNNFLGLTLFENGQMAFARYVPISPDEYDADDYVLEALNENIFRMEQFNKARGGNGLSNVILYGFIEDYKKIVDALDGLDIRASVLGTPSQITGYENFEFTVFANAIGALYRRNKQTERINLLEVDHSNNKDSSAGLSSMLTTAGILSAASAILIAAITGFIAVQVKNVDNEKAGIDAEIKKEEEIKAANQILHNRLELINKYKNFVQTVQLDIDTLPVMKKEKVDKIQEVIEKDKIKYGGMTYDLDNGSIVISQLTVEEQEDAQDVPKKFVDDLKELEFVAEVVYSGYTGTGEKDNPVVINDITVILEKEGE